jgi:integrase
LRVLAGVPEGIPVDLSLVKLPNGALMFWAVELSDFTKPRNPRNFSKEFARRAEVIGFGRIRYGVARGRHPR